jgi:hypothetical protein
VQRGKAACANVKNSTFFRLSAVLQNGNVSPHVSALRLATENLCLVLVCSSAIGDDARSAAKAPETHVNGNEALPTQFTRT